MDLLTAPSLQHAAIYVTAFVVKESLLWYKIPAAASAAILLYATARPASPRHPATTTDRSDLLYILTLALFLFSLQWPIIALPEFEGDESIFVSAAMTRYLAPAFGVTLFTGSAGPLLSYPLVPFGVLGIRIDYGTSKLLVLFLIIATWAVIYLALRTFTAPRTVRVALLPPLAFLGLANEPWTMSYCAEHWLNLLVALMAYCLLRLVHHVGSERPNLVGLGLTFGLIPLVKWQGLPMGAVFLLLALVVVGRRAAAEASSAGVFVRKGLLLLAPAAVPFLAWCALLGASGNLTYFLRTYVVALFNQANTRFTTSLLERLIAFPRWGILPFGHFTRFVYAIAGFCVMAIVLLALRRSRTFFRDLTCAILYLAASMYAVLKPGGPFPHYVILLLQPYSLLAVLTFCQVASITQYARVAVGVYLAITVGIPTVSYLQGPALITRAPRVVPPSYTFIWRIAPPGSPMIVWGWDYASYVDFRMIWGSQTGGSSEILEPFFGDRRIFVDSYVASLKSGRAPVFLDTATEGAWYYAQRAVYGHEMYPEIAEAVRENYVLCGGLRGARLYLQRRTYAANPELGNACPNLLRR